MKRLFSKVYVAALVIWVMTIAVAAWQLHAVGDLHAERIRTTDRMFALFWIHIELVQAETAQRGYLLTGDAAYRQELAGNSDQLARLLEGLGDDAESRRLHELASQRMAALMEVVTLYEAQGSMAAVELVRRRGGASLMEQFTTLSRAAIDDDRQHLEGIRARTASTNTILNLLLAVGAVLILVMTALTVAAQRRDLRAARAMSTSLEVSNRRVTELNELGSNLLACRGSEEAYEVIVNALMGLFPGTAGGVYAYKASRDILELQGRWGDPDGEPQQIMLPDECWGLRRGHAHVHRDATDLPCQHWRAPDSLRSLCMPMMAQGDTVGLIFFQCRDDADADVLFAENVRALADTAVSQIAGAVASLSLRAALQLQSVKDPLTGLYNRRFLEESLQRELVRAERSGSPLALIMTDIDHFKKVNDLHGHQAGDLLLQRFGSVLLAGVRGGDVACRYGGEEFTLVLPGADLEMAARRAEEIRAAVEGISGTVNNTVLPRVTASFGVAVYPRHGTDQRVLIQRADAALYRAKQEGRNRVVTAD